MGNKPVTSGQVGYTAATMRALSFIFISIFLQACAAFGVYACPSGGTSTPAVSEVALRTAWITKIGMLPSPACDAHWAFSIVTQPEMDRACPSDNGCTVFTTGNGTVGCPLSMTISAFATNKELATHEFAHYALKCATGSSDPTHSNKAVWGPGGFDGSIQ